MSKAIEEEFEHVFGKYKKLKIMKLKYFLSIGIRSFDKSNVLLSFPHIILLDIFDFFRHFFHSFSLISLLYIIKTKISINNLTILGEIYVKKINCRLTFKEMIF